MRTKNRRRPSLRTPLRAAVLCAALAACAEERMEEPPPAPPAPPPQAEPAAPPPKLPAEKPRRHAALPPAATPQLPPATTLAPEMLVGLDREQVVLLLGAPTAVREQPPATVWSYRVKDCALNVFFYPDVQTREMRALAYDVLAGSEAEQARNACFAAIRARPKEQ